MAYGIAYIFQFFYISHEYILVGNFSNSSASQCLALFNDVFLGFHMGLAEPALVVHSGSLFEIVFYW